MSLKYLDKYIWYLPFNSSEFISIIWDAINLERLQRDAIKKERLQCWYERQHSFFYLQRCSNVDEISEYFWSHQYSYKHHVLTNSALILSANIIYNIVLLNSLYMIGSLLCGNIRLLFLVVYYCDKRTPVKKLTDMTNVYIYIICVSTCIYRYLHTCSIH